MVHGVQGELSVMPLADVIIWLGNRGMSGTLKVERGTQQKQIIVERGAAVRVDSNSPREALGQHLVNFGLVTEDQLTRAFQVQQETKVLLGRILVMIGIVREEQVVRTLDFLIRETILDALRWGKGRFSFIPEGHAEVRPDIEISVPLVEIHREGARRAPLWDQFRKVFDSPSMTLMVNGERITTQVPPESYDGRILSLAQLGLSIEAIAMETHSTDFHLYARLHDLNGMGIIEPREPSSHNTGDLFKLSTPVPIDESFYDGQVRPIRSPGPPTAPAGTPTGDLLRKQRTLIAQGIGQAAAAQALRGIPGVAAATVPAAAPVSSPAPADLAHAIPSLARPLDDVLKKRMSASERYILTRIDGTRTIQSIMQVSPMSDQEAIDIFQKLAKDGVIRL